MLKMLVNLSICLFYNEEKFHLYMLEVFVFYGTCKSTMGRGDTFFGSMTIKMIYEKN